MTEFNRNNQKTYGILIFIFALPYLLRISCVFLNGMFIFQITQTFLLGISAIALCCLADSRYRRMYFKTNVLYLAAYVCIVFLLSLLIQSSSIEVASQIYLKNCATLFVIWGIYVLMQMSGAKVRRRVAMIYLIGIVLSATYTLFVTITGPENVIRMTTEGVYYLALFPFKYGGYDFIYTLVIAYIGLICYLKTNHNKISVVKKSAIILMLILFALTIISANYTTAFILIAVFTVFNVFSKPGMRILFLALIGVLLFVFPQWLVDQIDAIPFIQDLTARRIREIILSFSGKATISDLHGEGNRLNRILDSLQILFEHPFIGGYAGRTSLVLGNHTEWIDVAAKYGLPAFSCFVAFWVGSFKKIIRDDRTNSARKYIMGSTIVAVFILGFLDPISMDVTIAPLFVLCPFLSNVFGLKQKTSSALVPQSIDKK